LLESKVRFFSYTISIFLASGMVNPIALSLLSKDPLILMLSHYSLFTSGAILGYFGFRGNVWRPIAYTGLIPPVLFHLPVLFVYSALYPTWTLADYTAMLLGGFLLGAGLKRMRILEKITIFVLYMIGDTLLAVLLVLGYPVYSPPLVQFSPFTTGQFYGVAYVMFLIMNSILFGVIGYVFKKFLSI